MKARTSLPVKILLLAFLNVVMLGLIFLVFARIQFRFDLSSFLLAPARDRILSVTRLIGLQLSDTPKAKWSELLAKYSSMYTAEFYLFGSDGEQLAGRSVQLPEAVEKAVRSDPFADHGTGRNDPPPRGGPPRGPSLALIKTQGPTAYWTHIHIPIWTPGASAPLHGTLVLRLPPVWTNPLFFDYRPWAAVVLAVLLVSVACWLPFIRSLTRSIGDLTKATREIAEGRFDLALPANRADELGRLSVSINSMARRLAGFVHGQRRFLGDIAHELCSPLARIQMTLGILEQRADDKQAEYVDELRSEVEQMSKLIAELLAFSKVELSSTGNPAVRVNVAEVVVEVLAREGSDQVRVETDIAERLEVIAHPEYLFRSLANLVRNAIRYAGSGGPIVISARSRGESILIMVADSGPGLPEDELENIFKPFYRPELARQPETGGTGLGLAIVRSCVEACGGAVECRNRTPRGLEVEIRLPAAV